MCSMGRAICTEVSSDAWGWAELFVLTLVLMRGGGRSYLY